MRRTVFLCALLALFAGVLAPSAQARWTPTASGRLALDTNRSATSPSLAVIGGAPWVAWREDTGTGAYDVHVARWNGSAWTTVGGALNVDASRNAYLPQLVDVGGTPWVAWTETNGAAYQLRVKRWDGSAWTAVGGALNVDTTKDAHEPGMANVGGTTYVAWNEPDGSNVTQVRIKSWDGSSWTSAGPSLNADATKAAVNTQIAAIAGKPHVTWVEVVGGITQVHVKSWDGSTWTSLGGVINVNPAKVTNQPILTDIGGDPYLAWTEYGSNGLNQVHVAHWTSGAWALVGGVLNLDATHHAEDVSIASFGGNPYVVWSNETDNGSEVHAAGWTGSAWSVIGDALNPGSQGYDPEPRIVLAGGVPYVAWAETGSAIRQVRLASLAVDVLDQQATATATGATLSATVRDFGLPLPVAFQYGAGASLASQTATQTTPGTGTATLRASVSGLSAATGYAWRAVGLDPFGAIAPAATQAFTTGPAGKTTPGTTTPGTTPTPVAPRGPASSCKAGKPKHGHVKVTCTVRLAVARSGRVRVTLERGKVRVARGSGRLSRGSATLKLSARKRVRPGSYKLVIKAGKATVGSITVRVA
jgi:hypothetical protein